LNIELTLCIPSYSFAGDSDYIQVDKFAEGLKSLMKKEDDEEERSEGFVRIYENTM